MNPEIKEIRKIRKKLNITQKQLAKLSGVSQSLIAKIESGNIEPTYSKAQKIFSSLKQLNKKGLLTAKDIINRKIKFISPNDNIKKAAKLMQKNEISQLPVMEKDTLLGIITESTILKHILEERDFIVKDIMEDSPPIISLRTDIDTISNILINYPLVLVQEKGKIKGLITKSDLISKKYSN
jgi:predicted transcriptional regulator